MVFLSPLPKWIKIILAFTLLKLVILEILAILKFTGIQLRCLSRPQYKTREPPLTRMVGQVLSWIWVPIIFHWATNDKFMLGWSESSFESFIQSYGKTLMNFWLTQSRILWLITVWMNSHLWLKVALLLIKPVFCLSLSTSVSVCFKFTTVNV